MHYGFRKAPLAVIGIACRFPGAESLDEYWALVRNGQSSPTVLPPHRLDQELYYHREKGILGKTYSRIGGVVSDRPFNRELCPIPDEVIAASDPSHLIMLEVAAAACRHAGFDAGRLPLRNTGVFIGHARGSPLVGDMVYSTHVEELVHALNEDIDSFRQLPAAIRSRVSESLIAEVRLKKPHRVPGGTPNVQANGVAALITESFGLTGPYMAVDAACASSLYALALAGRALQDGRIDMAIVGGASYSSWQSLVLFSHAQALSDGFSCPFDARADGFVSSDGYAALLVKTLPRALANGDHVLGVIQGIGISCDGRGKSLWAPRKEGQIEAILRAYAHGVDPARVQYVEAHGTSTQLGDTTEVDALTIALGSQLPPGSKIPIASVKANIGHTREAAGLAGLIKTLLAMKHGVVPAAINFESPNQQISWNEIPFFVPTTEMEWLPHADDGSRRAAVDSFGIGGLNAHVVIDQQDTKATRPFTTGSSARLGDDNGRGAASRDDEAVAIVGWGAILPGASTVAEYWDLLQAGRDPKTDVKSDRWNPNIYCRTGSAVPWRAPTGRGGFVDFEYDWQRHKIPPKQLEAADPLQFMLLDATDQAFQDANIETKPLNQQRTSVVVGTIFGGDFSSRLSLALQLPEFGRDVAHALRANGVPGEEAQAIAATCIDTFRSRAPALRDETGSYSSSTLASRIARTFDLMGGAFAVDAGEASSLAALSAAVDLLVSGVSDAVVCAGGQRAMDITVFEAYALRGMLSPEPGGLLLGEGACVLLLKRLTDARRAGDRIHAIVRGVASVTDTNRPGAAVRTASEGALRHSGVSAPAVIAVEAGGLGVPGIEADELQSLSQTYGSKARTRPLWTGSAAIQIGHTLGAAGMASILKMGLALERRFLPPFAQGYRVAPSTHEGILMWPIDPVPLQVGREEDFPVAAVTAVSFRGVAYHVVLERGTASHAIELPPIEDWRIIRLGAPTIDDLRLRVRQALTNAESLYAAASLSGFTADDRARLAIVATNARALEHSLKSLAQHMSSPQARAVLEDQGIFCREITAQPPRVVLLFPGQGSQYVGMLRELTREVPAAAAMLRELDATMSTLGYESFAELAWADGAQLGTEIWPTQASVLMADTIMYGTLRAMGIRPAVISAHSYGEYAALVAAEAWTFEQAVRVTKARCSLLAATDRAKGTLLSTTAPLELIESLMTSIAGTVRIANYNSPDQTVVGGDRLAVAEMDSLLAAAGFENKTLPVPCAFHTPLLEEIRTPLRRVLEQEGIQPPTVPVLSSVTCRYVADPEELRDNLVAQLTEPVRYVDLIQRLERDGATVFLEVGPRAVLTRLNRRILPGSNALLVPSDNPKRAGVVQLMRMRAALEVGGISLGDREGNGHRREERQAGIISIVHFDATLARKHGKQTAAAPTTVATSGTVGADADELSVVLVDFICEQTGYPRDIISLDADLEADLGIDSIKKAQLLGELRERYNLRITSTQGLSLGDFPTLRSVLEFLKKAGVRCDEARASHVAAQDRAPAQRTALPSLPTDQEHAIQNAPLTILRLTGSAVEMGSQHARSQGGRIRTILDRYCDLLGRRPDEVQANIQAFHELLPDWEEYFTSASLEELRGMAEVAGVPPDYLIAYNLGLSPERIATGCTHFAITASDNASVGLIHGANEDSPLSLHLPDCLTRVVQVRHPGGAHAHIIFSTPGQVGGLNGLNSRGVAVTSTMLLDREWRSAHIIGVIHPIVVKTLLEQAEDIPSAIDVIRGFRRTGAWSLCISHHPTDRLCYVEYDGQTVEVTSDQKAVMTTNHCLMLRPLTAIPDHSLQRLSRLKDLLRKDGQPITVQDAKAALRDRLDPSRQRHATHLTLNTILRVDNQISVVMHPARGQAWVTPGPLTGGAADQYHELDLNQLLKQNAPAALEGDSPISMKREEHVMSRFVLRMADAPLDSGAPRRPSHGAALVVGQNATAQALRASLQNLGVRCLDLPGNGRIDDELVALDRLWEEQPFPHLFITTARDEPRALTLDANGWAARRERGMMLPYAVCQRWIQHLQDSQLAGQASLVAVTALGGDFGFSGHGVAVEGGALSGLLKSIRRENPGLLVKVIDTPLGESAALVAREICEEVVAATPEVEVGYVRGRRSLVRAVPRPIDRVDAAAIARGGTWIVTGGGRGITAVVARELGQRFDLHLHLIGTTRPADASETPEALPRRQVAKQVELATNLRALADAGVRATYHCCDISDRDAAAKVLQTIRSAGAPISGVIHGAGIEEAAGFVRKRLDRVAATLSSKIDGAFVLMDLLRDDPLAFFVAFSSVSGRFGGHGQTDYSMASDMLCKLMHVLRAQRPQCRAVAFQWPAWDDVGMAMRPESKLALAIGEQRFMPPLEGVDHLINELAAGAPEGEVLIIDRPGLLDLDGILPTTEQRTEILHHHDIGAGVPLITGLRDLDDSRGMALEARFDPVADPFLREHTFHETPVLPAVIGLELLAEAAHVFDPKWTVVALRDVEIVNGLRFYTQRTQDVCIRALRNGKDIACQLKGPFVDRSGTLVDPHRVYMTGTVELAPGPVTLTRRGHEVADTWHEMQYLDEKQAAEQRTVFHGPSLRCLKQVALRRDGASGRILVPPLEQLGASRPGQWIIPAAVLDACLVVCGVFARKVLEVPQLPRAFKCLRLGALPRSGDICNVDVQFCGKEGRNTGYDFTLSSSDGTVILMAEGHQGVILTATEP